MRKLLLDTGAFVALLDKSEKKHRDCVDFFSNFQGKIFTTEPVLTETLYLLNQLNGVEKVCIEFIFKGGITLVPQSNTSLSRAVELMGKYKDIPMDFADATLVSLAEEIGTNEIFTLDLRGFNTYRIHKSTPFKIYPL